MFRELHGTPTFMTEALRLVHDVQHLNRLIVLNEQLTQHYLTLLWRNASLLRPCLSILLIASAL